MKKYTITKFFDTPKKADEWFSSIDDDYELIGYAAESGVHDTDYVGSVGGGIWVTVRFG